MTDTDVPRPATGPLLALAAACRPDWSIDQLRDVLAQIRCQNDMPFGRLVVAVAQLIADPAAEPPTCSPGHRSHGATAGARPHPTPHTAEPPPPAQPCTTTPTPPPRGRDRDDPPGLHRLRDHRPQP